MLWDLGDEGLLGRGVHRGSLAEVWKTDRNYLLECNSWISMLRGLGCCECNGVIDVGSKKWLGGVSSLKSYNTPPSTSQTEFQRNGSSFNNIFAQRLVSLS